MTRSEWLALATKKLENASHSARLDSELLLSFVLNCDRTQLLATVKESLNDVDITSVNALLKRRLNHEPIAYLTGQQEFYGRTFFVNKHVLIPRPETEALVSTVLSEAKPSDIVCDVGTGSGAIAISVKCTHADLEVIATDISPEALNIARKNADYHNCAIRFLQMNLMEGVEECDIVAANLPYVAEHYPLSKPAEHEPKLALFGGKDGLDYYRELFAQIIEMKKKPRIVVCEAEPFQEVEFTSVAMQAGYRLTRQENFLYVFEVATY